MKFSVLLPTHNRLELLKYAVASVVRQDYSDWEIIVSDNFSEQDIKGYVSSLGDTRIKYYRTDSFVSVTDNWNLALEKSSGEYVIMLGDDDCLMQGYFTHLAKSIETDEPEVIYTGAFQYVYPGVLSEKSQLHLYTYDVLKIDKEPFFLSKERAEAMVRDSLNFKSLFGYNMQFALVKRKLIEKLKSKGPFFQSPYPDYYAMNCIFLNAERILVYPKPLVTIGISPKSFGFYYFNNREKEGVQFLNNQDQTAIRKKLEKIFLPGTDMNSSWLMAMETIHKNYSQDYPLKVNYNRYRLLQMTQIYRDYVLTKEKTKVLETKRRLTWSERLFFAFPFEMIARLLFVLPQNRAQQVMRRLTALLGTYSKQGTRPLESRYANILELFQEVKPEQVF